MPPTTLFGIWDGKRWLRNGLGQPYLVEDEIEAAVRAEQRSALRLKLQVIRLEPVTDAAADTE